jgi:DNA-binding NarL/FixJ family response regulator
MSTLQIEKRTNYNVKMRNDLHTRTGVGIVDDQQLFLKSLCILVDTFENFETLLDALNGELLLKKLDSLTTLPDILLIDVNMPVMDGIATVSVIAQKYPVIKMVALSMEDDDATIISMIRAGCCAYLLKDIHPDELEKALEEINKQGYYNADTYNINYRRLIAQAGRPESNPLSEKEKKFLQLACSDLTYKQIASQMFLSERTIDGYRESVFQKLKVRSRVGMVLEAIRLKIVRIS